MTHGDARNGTWRGNWRMEWVASTLHTTSELGVSSITTADAHTSAVSSRLNWRPCWFEWTRPFRRKTKSGFCACAVTFQTQSTQNYEMDLLSFFQPVYRGYTKNFKIPSNFQQSQAKKGEDVCIHAVNAYRWRGAVAPFMLNLGIRCSWVVSFTPRPLLPGTGPSVPRD